MFHLEFDGEGLAKLEEIADKQAASFTGTSPAKRATLEINAYGLYRDYSAAAAKGFIILAVLDKSAHSSAVVLTTRTDFFKKGHHAFDFYLLCLGKALGQHGLHIRL